MARITPAARSWGEWFKPRFLATGLSGADFADRIVDAGGKASRQAVSQWAKGEVAAEPNTVVAIAALLAEDPADALRAGGYGIVADAMRDRTVRLAGGEPEPLDEGVRLILARKGLTPEQQAKQIVRYKRRLADLLADTADIIDAVVEARENARDQAREA